MSNLPLEDGEYDITISESTTTLFQLKFSKLPSELQSQPQFELFPRQSSLADPSQYLVVSESTTNSKPLISEATCIKAKESDYVLVLDGSGSRTLELCSLDSIMRANKPKTTKKTVQELQELKQFYATGARPKVSGKSVGKPSSRWEKSESGNSNRQESDNESDEFNFDNFDQFDDELSYSEPKAKEVTGQPSKAEKHSKEEEVEEDIDMPSFDEADPELDNVLDQVLGEEDPGKDELFSDIELEDEEDKVKEKEKASVKSGTAPMSLRDLMGTHNDDEDEDSFSEEE